MRASLASPNLTRLKTFGRNFGSLSLINAISMITPLLVVPHLMRTLGTSVYGQVALHQYLGQIVLTFVDFGFPLYGVSQVAKHLDDRSGISQLVSAIYLVKLAVVVCLGLLATPLLVILKGGDVAGYSFGLATTFAAIAVVNSLYPVWLFQGVDRIHETILPVFAGRLLMMGVVLSCVRTPADFWLVPLALLVGAVAQLVFSAPTVRDIIGSPARPSTALVRKVARESTQVFWSRLAILGYSATSPILVNHAAGYQGVAIYTVCEKVINLARIPLDMVSSSLYSTFSREYQSGLARKVLRTLPLGGLACLLGVALFGPLLSWLMPALPYPTIRIYLLVYALALLPISAHGFLGTCVLLANGQRLALFTSMLLGAATYAVSMLALWRVVEDHLLLSIIGMTLVETAILLSRYFAARAYNLV